jgi:hypothetical protein
MAGLKSNYFGVYSDKRGIGQHRLPQAGGHIDFRLRIADCGFKKRFA